MNDSYINTEKIEKSNINYSISDDYSFTASSGATCNIFTSNSTSYTNKNVKLNNEKNTSNFYTINLDWFQFDCTSIYNGNTLESHSTARIKMIIQLFNHNPNFRNRYLVYLDGYEIGELFTVPNNTIHKLNEVSFKVNNAQLYSNDWPQNVQYVINETGLKFSKLTKVDIALDGNDILNKMQLLRKYLRNKTILIGNQNLNIRGDCFNKSELKWNSYTIGSRNYQKSAKIYNKSEELKVSNKEYITEFWKLNRLNTTQDIGRFELQLGTRHLRKFQFNSFTDYTDAGFLGKILNDEVKNWLKFYQVSLIDLKNHRKDIAIKHGKEKHFILWDMLPSSSIQLEKVINVPNPEHSAKRAITYTISEIKKGNTSDLTETYIDYIYATSTKYHMLNYSITKVRSAIRESITENSSLIRLIDRLILKNN